MLLLHHTLQLKSNERIEKTYLFPLPREIKFIGLIRSPHDQQLDSAFSRKHNLSSPNQA